MQIRLHHQDPGVTVLKDGALGTSRTIAIVPAAFMVGIGGLAKP